MDWIKVEKATSRKPEVLRLADILGVHPDHAFGLCCRFWCWCDDQMSRKCHAVTVTNVTLDFAIGHAGFTAAMVQVGWIVQDGKELVIPHFDRHLSKSAKERALASERKQRQRESVTDMSRSERDTNRPKSVTREEKSICIYTEAEKEALSKWMTHYRHRSGREFSDLMRDEWIMKIAREGNRSRLVEIIEYSICKDAPTWWNPDDDPAKRRKSANGKPHQSADPSERPMARMPTIEEVKRMKGDIK